MEQSENGLGFDVQTAEPLSQPQSTDSTTLGKFKDATSLLESYKNLQKEFTRRSQRLAELEKSFPLNHSESKQNEEVSHVDLGEEKTFEGKAVAPNKMPAPKYLAESWKGEVNEFFDKNPELSPHKKQIASFLLSHPEVAASGKALAIASKVVMAEKIRKPAEMIEDEEFVNSFVLTNPKIKNKIINEYVKNLNVAPLPKVIGGKGVQVANVHKKLSSFEEAGEFLMKTFK